MRSLSVIAISLVLVSTGQLSAQMPLGSTQEQDPFGGPALTPNEVTPPRRKPDSSPKLKQANQSSGQAKSQPKSSFPSVAVSGPSAARQRIEQILNRETSFDYLDQPLKDVIADISFSYEMPIIIDTKALDDYAIDTATPVTMSLKSVSLRAALRLMLNRLEITYVIRDEVLQITTLEVAACTASTRFYHVAELLPADRDGEVLVELIKTLVAPDTWCGSNGVGSIIYVDHLESLAIRQTDDIFHEIEGLLATTEKLAEMQPPRHSILGGMSGAALK